MANILCADNRSLNSALKLKASAKDEAKGYIEGHLIPVLKPGFDGFGTGVSVAASAAPVHPKKGKREAYTPLDGRRACSELALRDTDVDVHGSAKGGLNGCVWVDAGLEPNFGAKADL
ncbi:hypothetical protein PLEOSDRAFT_1103939 [Pleurotus ostreatus PC15]|uniref:Uncharacterized protein n=1 Tax=Pleurotus ostreatus (strain PC15) TaxID=1137138 RepID=A0A067NH87_PLEO1|nr:hypothetical protein PLEOSDRAFT_1103939 [Pleurotus ostreatus PC15]